MARNDLPTPDETTDAFWAAAHEGQLLIKTCRDCDRYHAYPRPFCPYCWSDAVDWVPASGRATLYTFSIVRQNDLPPFRDWLPYIAAVVDLDEGPRLMSNIVECSVDEVHIGMALELAVRQAEDVAVPVFRPVFATGTSGAGD